MDAGSSLNWLSFAAVMLFQAQIRALTTADASVHTIAIKETAFHFFEGTLQGGRGAALRAWRLFCVLLTNVVLLGVQARPAALVGKRGAVSRSSAWARKSRVMDSDPSLASFDSLL